MPMAGLTSPSRSRPNIKLSSSTHRMLQGNFFDQANQDTNNSISIEEKLILT